MVKLKRYVGAAHAQAHEGRDPMNEMYYALKRAMLANPKVKAAYEALAPEFERLRERLVAPERAR